MAFLSARKTARRLGVNESTVRRWLLSGRLKASLTSRSYAIDERDVEALAHRRTVSPDVQKLSQRIDALEQQINDFQKRKRRRSHATMLLEEASHIIDADQLPPGAIRCTTFAQRHHVNAKTMRYHLTHGLGGERPDYLAIPFGQGIDRWLSPEQQAAMIGFWTRHHVAFYQ